ncbi:methyltransferase domain-containing protein [Methylophaga sp. OBS4]|uniref:methyltransferase domain-containing protein n=1 Tax=Methylophaga sp. OBS4 TaxID=2991935 RepID=UPI0022565F18|nr:methyltransferase domain-containing protein [Methylophaga sp. OBS4]MCX4186834.1 class I SAM-dependent methyltransferase [Methylophaga sp. OBS4]
MDRSLWPDNAQEKSRYLEHHNDVDDPRFQAFVAPITDRIQVDFTPQQRGLDFGAGHAPVITAVLTQRGYNIRPYDPLFFNQPECLRQLYDYICSCEVIEHFHRPDISFAQLDKILLPTGMLFCMTELYHEGIDFHRWNYKNDPTHVFIYHRNTMSYIARRYGFRKPQISGRLVIFSR